MTAVALAMVLVLARALGPAAVRHVTRGWWAPIAYVWHDAVVVLLFAAFELVFRRRVRLIRAIYLVVALYVVLNLPVERAVTSPLTWPMWRAAGGALSDSIRYYATWANAGLVAAGLAALILAPRLCRRVPARPVLAAAAVCVALGPTASRRVDTQGGGRNAWTALAAGPAPSTAPPSPPRDWRASDLPSNDDGNLARLRAAAAGRNVVLVSLESTASQYLGLYGATEDIAPNLSALSRAAVVFDNAYAVYPESIKGLVSTLCSLTPAFGTPADAYRAVPCASLAGVLRDRGYRTALFHSGRFAYLGMDAVVRGRGYDVLADAGDIGGAHDSSFGIDEPSTVAAILRWIDAAPGRPFFVTYLPIAGHHPYETPERGPFSDRDEFGRYRNAVHYGDAALDALRRGLAARGVDRRTIWIIYGDHGEAFGQHEGNYGHTFQLYDENVHVPLVIAAPGLISGPMRAGRVVSLIDVAPTILDLLGCRVPAGYEGHSMLDGGTRMALFFTDYSLALAGLRDGPRKVIRDLQSGRSRWFDLEQDPRETVDLSGAHPGEMRRYDEILDGWIASTRRLFDRAS